MPSPIDFVCLVTKRILQFMTCFLINFAMLMRLTVKLIAVNIMGTAIKVEDMEGIVALAD